MESLHYLLMRAHGAVNREILDGAAKLGADAGAAENFGIPYEQRRERPEDARRGM